MRSFRTERRLWFPVAAGGRAGRLMLAPGRRLIGWLVLLVGGLWRLLRGLRLLILAMAGPAQAQISDERPPPGYFSASGGCGLGETVITYRDAGQEVNLQFDALGQLIIVEVMPALDGLQSPFGGRVFGSYSYLSSRTGYLKENEAVFTVTGRSGPEA